MPIKSNLHVDQLLSNLSVRYMNAEFIAEKAFPALAVKKDSDLYRIYTRNFRLPDTERADGGVANEHDFEVSTASYNLEWHALKDYVSDNQAQNYDMADLRADTVEELTDVMGRRLEQRFSDLFTTTNWSLNTTLTSTLAWSVQTTTSNPIPLFDTASAVVLRESGSRPNVAIMGHDGWIAFKNHISILDRIKYTSIEIGENIAKSLIGADELLISVAQRDTAAEGQADSISQMWGDVAWFGHRAPRISPKTKTAGVIFKKPRNMVKRWRDEEREAEAIEANMQFSVKIISSLSGYLIKDVV